jgi:hypothetical protein
MLIKFTIMFGMLLCFTFEAFAGNGSINDLVLLHSVANSKSWEKVLHYRNDESLIDSGAYFFSKDGKFNRLTELKATLLSFSEAEMKKLAFGVDSRCAFPYRFKMLKKYFNLADPFDCPELAEWLKDKDAEKTILVFASEYANNPASMMGHTFIRFQRKNQSISSNHVSFLDTVFNFAAQIPDDVGSVSYAVKGLTGGFDAKFSYDTFENQIERYNNMESRDIWEYELSLSEEQTIDLTLHLYELIQNARWEYFFFDENCSYHLLKAIEVVTPEHDLTGELNAWVIPIDTIKILIKSEIVKNWTYRPSLHSRIKRNYDSLTSEQRSIFHDTIDKDMASTADVAILDTAILYMNYKKHNKQGMTTESDTTLMRDLLRKRAQSGALNKTVETVAPIPPQEKPGTFRYGLGLSRSLSSTWLTANIRPAVHEYLSGTDPSGSNHEVVFLAPSLRYNISKTYMDLDHMVFISTANFRQTNPVGFSLAWRILVDVASVSDINVCRFCKSLRFLPAMGTAWAAFQERVLGIALATIHAEYSPYFSDNHRLGAGVMLQLMFHLDLAKLVTKAERWWDYRGSVNEAADLKLVIPASRDREIWASAEYTDQKSTLFTVSYNIYK